MTNTQGAAKAAPKMTDLQAEQEASWLGARLREPSTYAGLGTLAGAAAFFHLIPAGSGTDLVKYISMIGMGIGGLIAIFLPESARPGRRISGPSNKALAMLALCVVAAALMFAAPAMAASRIALPRPRPAAAVGGKPTVTQVQQNPLIVLQHFTVADLQAALADAKAQTPPDNLAANCYSALIPFVQSQVQNPLPAGAGIFQALQKARDAKAYLANIASPTGPLAGLNTACAPLVLDTQNTLLALGVSVGIVANPVGAAATLGGLPAAVAAFLGLPGL